MVGKKMIDMSRGTLCEAQLDLSKELLDVLNSKSIFLDRNGNDFRNYGSLSGLDECKEFFANILSVDKEKVFVLGNSSLHLMYLIISMCFNFGINNQKPWKDQGKIKWICPIPGYDRHFAMLEKFGIEMISVPLNEFGPDMDLVEKLVEDEAVKGIWCVPKYSNPSGITYSDEVIERFARLKPKAKDFRIYWDNAYSIHDLYEKQQIKNIFDECLKYNNEDIFFEFSSTSKITFPGGGVAAVVCSKNNMDYLNENFKYQMICSDKVNQMRHALFFKNHSLENLMKKHADIIKPRFALVDEVFSKEISDLATWSKPRGGYFILLKVNGCAKEIIEKAKELGVLLTESGATHPYHIDPINSYIRIAPTSLEFNELKEGLEIICSCIKMIAKQK